MRCLTECRSIEKRHGVGAVASVAGRSWLFSCMSVTCDGEILLCQW